MPDTPPTPDTAPPAAPTTVFHPNGLTDEGVKRLLAALGRRKNDPEYLQAWEEGAAEYRRQLQEELERELTAEGK